MALAGVGWGAYSLLGHSGGDPIAANAAAFLRAVLLATPLLVIPFVGRAFGPRGALLAIVSGALASGLGYCLWYRALPHLSRTRAAAVQLTVPVITATLGVLFLGETVTPRLLASGAIILSGVGLVLVARSPSPED
jgi:drug/metabolite transporter (DMT)-like permease